VKFEKLFGSIDPETLSGNVFRMLDKDWMLITSGTQESFNTMTASWGAFGVLWNKQVAFCFVRPQRYTYRFMERNPVFTLSFFEEIHREALDFCGSHSGRNVNKIRETGLTPVPTSTGNICFAEAWLVIECRKIYFDDLKPQHFLDESIHRNYPIHDYHRLYIGEIIGIYSRL
jgi:flavin reductase (DIM6/NTAB) family NADH-FMN oxidoreductase RutF